MIAAAGFTATRSSQRFCVHLCTFLFHSHSVPSFLRTLNSSICALGICFYGAEWPLGPAHNWPRLTQWQPRSALFFSDRFRRRKCGGRKRPRSGRQKDRRDHRTGPRTLQSWPSEASRARRRVGGNTQKVEVTLGGERHKGKLVQSGEVAFRDVYGLGFVTWGSDATRAC